MCVCPAQTSDLSATSMRDVLRRLAVESGNLPGEGLVFPRDLVQREVDCQLAAHSAPLPHYKTCILALALIVAVVPS